MGKSLDYTPTAHILELIWVSGAKLSTKNVYNVPSMDGSMMEKLGFVLTTITNLPKYSMSSTVMTLQTRNVKISNGNMEKKNLPNLGSIMSKKFMVLFIFGFMSMKLNNQSLISLMLSHTRQSFRIEVIQNILSGVILKTYLKMEQMPIISNTSINTQ